jgi:hypothetical protein
VLSRLPQAIVALRMRLFTRINGEEGIAIPGPLVGAERFKQVYSDPAAGGRSRGAALSDLFWYWLAPGPELHQEHIEAGELYEEVARVTRRILAIRRQDAERLTQRCLERVLDEKALGRPAPVRLRDLMMPVWAEFYYELVFQQRCPRAARALIVANADDVVSALKCCGLRHMRRRRRLTRYLAGQVRNGAVPHALPHGLSHERQALYLQGVFFNTAVVQSSEAMAHLLLFVAQHEAVQQRLQREDDEPYLDRVINEALRFHPLFGVSHRITTAEIHLDERTTIPAGSVLCFNHPEYQRTGFAQADRFDPDRWETLAPHDQHYIPFGVAANRPCPAMGLAPVTMRAATRGMLRRFALASSVSHTRSLANRAPCLLEPRGGAWDERARRRALARMQRRDRWEDLARSVVQLALGTYMVWDARRLKLCQRHFAEADGGGASPGSAPGQAPQRRGAVDAGPRCPVRARSG